MSVISHSFIIAWAGCKFSRPAPTSGSTSRFGILSIGAAHIFTIRIQPLPGHAVCNVGDALNIFSGGILRSNIHRVV